MDTLNVDVCFSMLVFGLRDGEIVFVLVAGAVVQR